MTTPAPLLPTDPYLREGVRPGAPGPLLEGVELEVAPQLNRLAVLATPSRQLLHLPDVRLRRLNRESCGARDQG